MGGATPGAVISPLATWFSDDRALARFRRRYLGRRPAVRLPRDGAWRRVAPDFETALVLPGAGLPFHTVADRRADRSADHRRLRRALAAGDTIYFPQVHQVLPRLMRLMVALRATLLGPLREECSFLFLVKGRGRTGLGLHHDGPVDAFWLQLEGRRTVTIGPRVDAGAPEDLGDGLARAGRWGGWRTLDLGPGTLFYLPPYTPHAVICRGRSLALSLTWRAPRRPSPRATAAGMTEWDVVSGQAEPRPRPHSGRLWTQVPVAAGALDAGRRRFLLATPDGAAWLPATARPLARRLGTMPSLTAAEARRHGEASAVLLAHGILADQELPLLIRPAHPKALDGWHFA